MDKIRVVIDGTKCDGCGLCASACHEGVIRMINGKAKVARVSSCDGLGACIGKCPRGAITLLREPPELIPHGCPGSKVFDLRADKGKKTVRSAGIISQLQNWPVQLHLVNPLAPFLKNASLLIAADCVGFAYPGFHGALLKNNILINFCPKLDQGLDVYADKLCRIFKDCNIRSITAAHMEVPCCSGLLNITREALKASGKNIPLIEVTVSIRGGICREG